MCKDRRGTHEVNVGGGYDKPERAADDQSSNGQLSVLDWHGGINGERSAIIDEHLSSGLINVQDVGAVAALLIHGVGLVELGASTLLILEKLIASNGGTQASVSLGEGGHVACESGRHVGMY